jgi:hypothetical protein
MSKTLTAEQIFRKCFGPSPLRIYKYSEMERRLIARAARKFVRTENWQKSFDKSICRKCSEKRKHSICGTMRDVIQCSYFKTACRKTRRAG